MAPEPGRNRQIAEECRILAEEAKSRNWAEVVAFLNERALLHEQMADAMSRSVMRLLAGDCSSQLDSPKGTDRERLKSRCSDFLHEMIDQ